MRHGSRSSEFGALHVPGTPLRMPNAWDPGTARQLATMGYSALATTSSGHAGTFGLVDGGVGRERALAHAAEMAAAVTVPVSADLENGFGDDPTEVAETVRLAREAGLAGCSIEDHPASGEPVVYEAAVAAERVAAAAEAAHAGEPGIVLTARAENLLYRHADLGETISRLQSFQEAGADVLFAPGLLELADVETVVRSVDRPVSVLLRPGMTVAALAAVGVARVSVGGAFHLVALAAVEEAARELLEDGTVRYWEQARKGLPIRKRAFS